MPRKDGGFSQMQKPPTCLGSGPKSQGVATLATILGMAVRRYVVHSCPSLHSRCGDLANLLEISVGI